MLFLKLPNCAVGCFCFLVRDAKDVGTLLLDFFVDGGGRGDEGRTDSLSMRR